MWIWRLFSILSPRNANEKPFAVCSTPPEAYSGVLWQYSSIRVDAAHWGMVLKVMRVQSCWIQIPILWFNTSCLFSDVSSFDIPQSFKVLIISKLWLILSRLPFVAHEAALNSSPSVTVSGCEVPVATPRLCIWDILRQLGITSPLTGDLFSCRRTNCLNHLSLRSIKHSQVLKFSQSLRYPAELRDLVLISIKSNPDKFALH